MGKKVAPGSDLPPREAWHRTEADRWLLANLPKWSEMRESLLRKTGAGSPSVDDIRGRFEALQDVVARTPDLLLFPPAWTTRRVVGREPGGWIEVGEGRRDDDARRELAADVSGWLRQGAQLWLKRAPAVLGSPTQARPTDASIRETIAREMRRGLGARPARKVLALAEIVCGVAPPDSMADWRRALEAAKKRIGRQERSKKPPKSKGRRAR